MDFVMGALSNGRRLKCLNIVDHCTKEAIDIVIDHSITGELVARIFERASQFVDCRQRSAPTRVQNSTAWHPTNGSTAVSCRVTFTQKFLHSRCISNSTKSLQRYQAFFWRRRN